MLKVLSTKYANVTIEAIELYKSLCVECLKKRKRRAVKGVVVRPILSRDYGSHGQDRTLRSSDNGLLYRPRTSSDFESYCFRSAAPTIWNSLSVTTRTANSIGTFRSRLKTDLFAKAYAA